MSAWVGWRHRLDPANKPDGSFEPATVWQLMGRRTRGRFITNISRGREHFPLGDQAGVVHSGLRLGLIYASVTSASLFAEVKKGDAKKKPEQVGGWALPPKWSVWAPGPDGLLD